MGAHTPSIITYSGHSTDYCCPAILIVYPIVNIVSQKVTGCYLRTGILLVYLRAHTHTSLVLSNVKMDGILSTPNFIGFNCTLQLPKNLVIEGSHIRARPIFPFYCGFDCKRGFGRIGLLACLFSVLSFR